MERVIVNGGDPINDCPKSWEEAEKILVDLNGKENYGPEWSFDCGYKLDFDGGILKASSRFYPPKDYYGKTWDGTVTIYLLDKEVSEKKFDCETLAQLKKEVDEYINDISKKVKSIFIATTP